MLATTARWGDRHRQAVALACWAGALVACAGVAIYLWNRPFGGDLYPDWLAERAFIRGLDAYANYGTPFHFQYPPGFLLIFAWMGLVPQFEPVVKQAFEVGSEIAIVIAALLCVRLFDRPWNSPFTPVLLAGLSLSPPVLITLIQGNTNGILVACEVGFLLLASRGRWVAAGALLGLGVTIKPLLLPLAVVIVAWRQWRALAVMLVVPLVLSGLALGLARGAGKFFSESVPYLLGGESGIAQGNTSLAGAAALLGVPSSFALVLRAGVGVAILLIGWMRMRQAVDTRVKLVDIASLAMLAAFLCFSFSSEYYAIYLMPLVVSVVLPGSAMRGGLAWVAVFLLGSPDLFLFYRLGKHLNAGPVPGTLRSTVGFLVLLVALAVATVGARQGRPPATTAAPAVAVS